jgi:L-cysteine/cystine lyase
MKQKEQRASLRPVMFQGRYPGRKDLTGQAMKPGESCLLPLSAQQKEYTMLNTRIDVEYVRQELPGATTCLYLNTATIGPLPRCVPQAIEEWLHNEWTHGRLGMDAYAAMAEVYGQARSAAARLLHVESEEIALTENTSEGLNIICHGLNWQPGDEVIFTNHEQISVISLLYHLRDRYGISLGIADLGAEGDRPAEEAIAALITPRTRLIVLSHVSFMTGAVINVSAVAELAHRSDILVLVDGAQSAGAIPLDIQASGVDFFAFPMQKWLYGPDGTGALYVRHEVLERVQPTYIGWCLLKFEAGGKWGFHDSARRFELGGRQTAAVCGQTASLRWLEETVGYPWIFERISSLNSYAYDALRRLPGLAFLTPRPGSSGLLSFTLEGYNAETVAHWLQDEHKIYVRAVPQQNSLRISTGFYNTEEEIDHLARTLQKVHTI